MKTIQVTIEKENFNIYVVTIQGEEVNVAEPRLEDKMIDLIENDKYCKSNKCLINGKESNVTEVSDLYYYVFGDTENLNPTEKEVIESISDIYEAENGNAFTDFLESLV